MKRTVLAVAIVAAASSTRAHAFWERSELAIPPGLLSADPTAINDAGQVVGDYMTADWQQRAFLLQPDGAWIDLGTLGGPYASARALNERGEIVGISAVNDAWEMHAFVWRDGQMIDLGPAESGANGVNDRGVVVGGSTTPGGFFATAWDGDATAVFGAFGGCNSSQAYGVNARGQVVGDASIDGGMHAFLWDARAGLQDLGTLGGPWSHAQAINDRGDVVVNSDTAVEIWCEEYPGGRSCLYQQRAFFWRAGQRTVLPDLGGPLAQAVGLNSRGTIAGTADTTEALWCWELSCVYRPHAVLWRDGRLIDLGEAGRWSTARGINDHGDVLGVSEVAPGVYAPVIWRER